MPAAKGDRGRAHLQLHVRLRLGEEIALGPGKADLLEGIRETGSIAAAGRRMGMSYRRAWLLVDTMNRCFRVPLVEAATGGVHGGGARLTPLGERMLARYRALVGKLEQQAAPVAGELAAELRPAPRVRAEPARGRRS